MLGRGPLAHAMNFFSSACPRRCHVVSGGARRAPCTAIALRTPLRDSRHSSTRVLPGHRVIRAAYVTVCGNCKTLILPGHYICMDAARNRFVHESCVQVHARLVQAAARARAVEDADTLPHGLKPSTLRTYSREWERYLAFVHRQVLGSLSPAGI